MNNTLIENTMYKSLFCKELKSISREEEFLNAVKNNKLWWTANHHDDNLLSFVSNKLNAGFYMSRLKRFPNIVEFILETYPGAIIQNSYVTKCLPGYHMIPHIDTNRTTAIVIPLGYNKGKISFYFKKWKVLTHTYQSPALIRVDLLHSAENDSKDDRYSLTIEISGSYLKNYFKY